MFASRILLNHQPGVLNCNFRKKTRKDEFNYEVFLGFFFMYVWFDLGSSSYSTSHVPEFEATHAHSSRIVDCFRGEIHHSREAGPPEPPQRDARRPPSKTIDHPRRLKIITRPPQNPIFHPSMPRKPHEHRPGPRLRSEVRSLYPRWCLQPARGFHPRQVKSKSLFGGARRNN